MVQQFLLEIALIIFRVGVGVSLSVLAYYGGKHIKSKKSAEEFEHINELVKTAVVAAEYMYKNEKKSGPIKYQYVVDVIKNEGIDIDKDTLDIMINQAIAEEVLTNDALMEKVTGSN